MFLSLTSCKTQVSQPFPAPSNNFSIFSLFWWALLHLFKGKFEQIHSQSISAHPSTGCSFGPTEFKFPLLLFLLFPKYIIESNLFPAFSQWATRRGLASLSLGLRPGLCHFPFLPAFLPAACYWQLHPVHHRGHLLRLQRCNSMKVFPRNGRDLLCSRWCSNSGVPCFVTVSFNLVTKRHVLLVAIL